MMDSNWDPSRTNADEANSPRKGDSILFSLLPAYGFWKHSGATNAIFFDGHAESLRIGKISLNMMDDPLPPVYY